MDYNAFEDNIKNFFSNNYKTYALEKNNALAYNIIVSKGFPDSDTSGQVKLFLLPMQYQYSELTNDSKLMQFEMKIFLLLKQLGKNSTTMSEYLRDYASALHNMIYGKNTLGGAVDKSLIANIEFFDEVEGFEGSKGFEANILLLAEVQGN